jgi:hypothetical protein
MPNDAIVSPVKMIMYVTCLDLFCSGYLYQSSDVDRLTYTPATRHGGAWGGEEV